MKKVQRNSFKLNPIAASIVLAMSAQLAINVAYAGAGFGAAVTTGGSATQPPTFYANSPSGPIPALTSAAPAGTLRTDGSGLLTTTTTGTPLRKFVDTLPGFGLGAKTGVYSPAKANGLGQFIPVAVPEKWSNPLIIDPATKLPVVTGDDYYEIAAVDFSEKLHSDLPKATHMRGYVQIATPGSIAAAKAAALAAGTTYNGPYLPTSDGTSTGIPLVGVPATVQLMYPPHHLGPIITGNKGTAVRVKFTNYLPVGGKLFLPVDPTITGAGVGADGVTPYTQNRAGMHLVGGQSPWISAGSPHQWIAPAGEINPGIDANGNPAAVLNAKGPSAQSAPDMPDAGAGSTYLYFPNDMSARFTFIQDRTSGLTRLNSYAGLEAGYVVTDPIEQILINGGTLSGGGLKTPVTVAKGTIPAAQLPLIIEDKTFVPVNFAQQDARWDAVNWGAPGDLWFPHVYEPNQADPTGVNTVAGLAGGANPVGRWDYGPLFWPIFPVVPAKSMLPNLSFVPEAYMDTPLVNGTAYPTVAVEAKAYRVRVLNGSNDRYYNLGLYVADSTPAPLLDVNGNPTVDALTGAFKTTPAGLTEVKMVAATPIDTLGSPPGWDVVNGVQLPLPQFGTTFPWNINAEPSGPTRAWPTDGRVGGAPDPTTSGPDFVVIGNDGGLLPQGVDIPPQPVTYEQNRRSITVTNIYGYGLLLGPSERADTIVDFTPFAGKTLILYNDAPAPTPFTDPRNDYFTGDADNSATGGAYPTLPGYGPNTRTIMQITVGAKGVITNGGGALNATALAAALPAAYAATQPVPFVPESIYNAAFGTTDPDNYGRVATGSAAQPTLNFSRSSATLTLTPGPMTLVTSGGTGTGSGTGYTSVPQVVISAPNLAGGQQATAVATINASGQVASATLTSAGSGYTSMPTVTFVPTSTVASVVVADGGAGYLSTDKVVFSGGGAATQATGTLTVSSSSAILGTPTMGLPGSGYTVPPTVTFTGGGGSGATGVATISSSALVAGGATLNASGSGYTNPTPVVSQPNVPLVANGGVGVQATATATVGFASAAVAIPAGGFLDVNSLPIAWDAPVPAGGGTTVINFSAPSLAGGTMPVAKVTVDPITALITAINYTSYGSGYTSATPPVATISDGKGNSVIVTGSINATSGQVFGVSIATTGAGYTTPATITFTDATGTGAQATASLAGPAGAVTGFAITNVGSGYTSAPAVTFTDSVNPAHSLATAATGTVVLSTPVGTITGVKVLTPGSGYTSAPSISITNAANGASTGLGALLTPSILAAGTGAQATVATSTSASFVVATKAEQELYDDWGRYNSTGGMELPLTLAGIQTTVPLGYIDAPTDIIGDDETQIWKLVDNGFWSNSIHFSMADVQLINRVGWDGTVKPPASNEVGWKDTVRLNPLEDVIVAVHAKGATVPFGQPRSTRTQDPSVKLGVAGSGLGFTADPAVTSQAGLLATTAVGVPFAAAVPAGTVLLATAVNTATLPGSPTGNYDNEFLWGSAILGHAENDFTRPVVFNPVVNTPATSVILDPLGTGTMNWTDPTPTSTPATTLANPQNELGYKLLQATATRNAAGSWSATGAFTPLATPYLSLPANVTQYIEPATNVSPTAAAYYAYKVDGYNVAGSSDSNVTLETPPNAPTSLALASSFALNATTTSDVQLAATWTDNALNETNYYITRTGPSLTAPVVGKVTGTAATIQLPANTANVLGGSPAMTWSDPTLLVEGNWYEYDVLARNSFGDSLVVSNTVQAPISAPQAPTALTAVSTVASCSPTPVDAITKTTVPVQCKPNDIVLTWTNNAFNATSYTITRTGGPAGTAFATVTLTSPAIALNTVGAKMTWTDSTAQEGYSYAYVVSAVNTSIAAATQVASVNNSATPVAVNPTAPTIPTNVIVTLPSLADPTTLITIPNGAVAGGTIYSEIVKISASDNAYNDLAYQVYRDGLLPANAVGSALVTPATGGSAANNPIGIATTGWLNSPVLNFTDGNGIQDGTTHTWYVAAINGNGTTPSVGITKIMPGIVINQPLNLRATPNATASSIRLCWNDNSTNETAWFVEESVSNTVTAPGVIGNWTVPTGSPFASNTTAGTGGQVCFSRANVPTTVGNVYTFRVSALNLANHSDSHPYLYAQSSLIAPPAPVAPTLATPIVTFNTNTGLDRVRLTWNKVTPVAGTTMNYLVFANGVQIGVVGQPFNAAATTVTYAYVPTAAAIAAGISYTVEAVQNAIVQTNPLYYGSTPSLPSTPVTLTPLAAPSAPTVITPAVNATTGAVTLNWTAPAAVTGVTYTYQVSVAGGAAVTLASGGTLNVPRGTNTTVQVRTIATDAQGVAATGVYSAAVVVNTLPAQSTALTNVLSATARTFNVGFTNTSTNITGFTIQRGVSATAGGAVTWTTIAVTPTKVGNVYSFSNLVPAAGFYRFRIQATSLAGTTAVATTPTVQTP